MKSKFFLQVITVVLSIFAFGQTATAAPVEEKLAIQWANSTGAKLVELLKLKVADVKYGEPQIFKDNKKCHFNQEIRNLIKQVVKNRADEEPLFKTINGKFLDRIQVYRNFKEICKELGLKGEYSATSWRKTFGYHYYKQYGDLTFLQWMFNQTNVEETLKFIDVDMDLSSRFQTEFSL